MSEYEQVEHGTGKGKGKRGEKKLNERTGGPGMRRLIQCESRDAESDGAYDGQSER